MKNSGMKIVRWIRHYLLEAGPVEQLIELLIFIGVIYLIGMLIRG